ncbi:MAG: hypothetical protein ACK4YQ_03255 [Phenylobacterium sp.]|uniref:hypothetical protein n=1 Tax=Phenylobacterium sp. TaxID=1871053 RepID=UPI00391B1879
MRRRAFLALIALPAAVLSVVAGPAAASGGGEKKAAGPASPYVRMPILTATVRKRNGKRGVLTVETGLDVPDPKVRELAEASTPRLRAAYFQVLQTYANGLAPGAPPNADFLGRELQRETDRVLGRPGARLLFGTILMN